MLVDSWFVGAATIPNLCVPNWREKRLSLPFELPNRFRVAPKRSYCMNSAPSDCPLPKD
jgi:hypothetical protein